MTEKLGLIGHDRVLIEKLAKQIWHDLPHGTMVTPVRDTADRRGFRFDIQILDDAQKPTGHVARVQVTLDRFEAQEGGQR
jgi:hypothetical protein